MTAVGLTGQASDEAMATAEGSNKETESRWEAVRGKATLASPSVPGIVIRKACGTDAR